MDREKVIEALHCRAYDDDFPCWKCAYYKQDEKPVARCDYRGLMDDAIALLKEQEAVIRCKDCKYFNVIKWTEFHRRIWPEDGPECYSCLNPRCNCEEVLPTRGPDWYCADGERKEGR